MSGYAREKLQYLYANVMSHNFSKTAVLTKYTLSAKAAQQRILTTHFGAIPMHFLEMLQAAKKVSFTACHCMSLHAVLALDFPHICLQFSKE